jgi:hypothetical protein
MEYMSAKISAASDSKIIERFVECQMVPFHNIFDGAFDSSVDVGSFFSMNKHDRKKNFRVRTKDCQQLFS